MTFLYAISKNSWFPKPKVLAAIVVGGIVYGLGAIGVDVGTVLKNLGDEVGVNVPDPEALSVGAAAIVAAYIKRQEQP
jgi:pyruvate/2-oxoglutarate dehydrogenase complex dihydrolipoamide dehydrogenase (E3) component